MRSDELERFRGRLGRMRSRLMDMVNGIGQAIHEDIRAPGEVSTVPTHPADMDVEDLDKNVALAENEAQLLHDVEAALERIEQGHFGQCQRCDRPIARKRLDALPHTPYCIDCAQVAESESPGPEQTPQGPATTG